ncbi:hypothetical protein Pres01_47820 [Metapseudomonas resinovorans]|uniref:multiubiquitin domain-containing protein n=1 Tax=Metapseudomonas resinovorans TaxID=53412 RepID=UPI00098560B1|nr:multiubiquitin domain-containing protein [Pseudomonas resinovorans]GLZ88731.1 hypothetical protein Pres01_47820 [Pseudomonas resinovorans]
MSQRDKPEHPHEPANPDHGKPNQTHIIVNGRPRTVEGDQVSYAQIVAMGSDGADPSQAFYTVQYTGPHVPDGTLAEGQTMKIYNGMKFDVSKTNRS